MTSLGAAPPDPRCSLRRASRRGNAVATTTMSLTGTRVTDTNATRPAPRCPASEFLMARLSSWGLEPPPNPRLTQGPRSLASVPHI